MADADPALAVDRTRLWAPRRVLITRAARGYAHGRAMAERAAALGAEVVELAGDQLRLNEPEDPRRAYAEAKATLAVTVASAARMRFQPIAPSADFRVDLAEGCPAHCQYCYLAGSLKGAPITRAYANVEEILGALPAYLGQGKVTSRSVARAHEGTTFEASCYTDPLGIEHLTGSLAVAVAHFGRWQADAQLRFTTKFAAVDPLLGLVHGGATRMRASVNSRPAARLEGGADPVPARLRALRRMADAGYPVGLTIAPIIAEGDWRSDYGQLSVDAGAALAGAPALDLTVELITHRFTDTSKAVLSGWYPGSSLAMADADRSQKRTKFGAVKHVYPAELMRELKRFFYDEIARSLPSARILYWT